MFNNRVYRWLLVGLLWVVALLNYMDRQILSTLQPAISVDIPQLRLAENFGQLMAVFLWIYAIIAPFAGMAGDKFDKKWVIVYSLGIWSLITFLMGFAQNFTQLYILRAGMGFSEALYLPAALALIASVQTDKSRGLAFGIHMTGLFVGQALGGFGAILSDVASWRLAFITLGLFGVCYAFLLSVCLRSSRATSEKIDNRVVSINLIDSFKTLLRNQQFIIILFYFGAISMPSWASKNWLPTLFAQNLDLEMKLSGPIATISLAVASFIGVMIGGMLSDKLGARFLRGRVFVLSMGLFLCIPGLIFMGFCQSAIWVIISCICFGVGFGFLDASNMPVLCQFIDSRSRAGAYGFMNTVGVSAGGIVTILFGKLSDDGNLGTAFASLAIFMAIVLVVVSVFLKPKKQNV